VVEDDAGWTIALDVPGVTPDALDVLAEDRTLTIRGERSTTAVRARLSAAVDVSAARRGWITTDPAPPRGVEARVLEFADWCGVSRREHEVSQN
jgi:hypothetical protein